MSTEKGVGHRKAGEHGKGGRHRKTGRQEKGNSTQEDGWALEGCRVILGGSSCIVRGLVNARNGVWLYKCQNITRDGVKS